MIYYSNSEEDTIKAGEALAKEARKGDIYCLIGELGAGKTVFAKGFALGLGICSRITSPTFTLVNEYAGRLALYHFDAYRLDGADNSSCFEFDEYFEMGGVCLVEWADKIAGILPDRAVFVVIERDESQENGRVITITSERI